MNSVRDALSVGGICVIYAGAIGIAGALLVITIGSAFCLVQNVMGVVP